MESSLAQNGCAVGGRHFQRLPRVYSDFHRLRSLIAVAMGAHCLICPLATGDNIRLFSL